MAVLSTAENGATSNTQPTNSAQPRPSPRRSPSPLHIPSAEVDANVNNDACHQLETSGVENQGTVEDATHPGSQESANTVASEVPQERSLDNPVGRTLSLRPTVCRVSADRKKLCPTGPVSRAITDSFHRMWFTEGHCWKGLLPNQVEFYWQEFKFQCAEPEVLVRATWVNHASTRYTDNLSKYRPKFERTGVTETHIKQEIWDAWLKQWDTPDYKVKRQKMSINRRTEKAGPGTGMSRHTCGTKSMLDRHMTTADPETRKPDLHKIFLETIQKRKTK